MEATISKGALGINKLLRGDFLGSAKAFAMAPISPVSNILQGRKLHEAWMGKSTNPEANQIADLMAMGGGRVQMDKFYASQADGAIKKAIQDGKYLEGAIKTPFWLLQKASAPIMEYIVPRQKMGIFYDMMKMEMESNPNATHEEMRVIAKRAWKSVDNRMGQMVYDNLFWSHVTKDLALASVRSVGWNLGTFREIGGGITDFGKQSINLLNPKAKSEMTYRMAYVMALPILAGLYGATYMYLRTGKKPEELKDYYFPQTGGLDKNGDPARVALPTYMKDVYHYMEAPGKTLINKLSPVNNVVANMIANKDFYGTEIRGEDDPISKQVGQVERYLAEQFIPFGIRNLNKDTRKGLSSKIEPFIGITPAPYDINMTEAEKKASKMQKDKMPIGSRTHDEAEYAKTRARFRNDYKIGGDKALIREAVQNGSLKLKDAEDILKNNTLSPLERMTKNFTFEEVYSLWEDATPKEKEFLKIELRKKASTIPNDDRERLMKVKEALKVINKE
jgi:hypothetical protein